MKGSHYIAKNILHWKIPHVFALENISQTHKKPRYLECFPLEPFENSVAELGGCSLCICEREKGNLESLIHDTFCADQKNPTI